jgi:pilus assembly protein CpaE
MPDDIAPRSATRPAGAEGAPGRDAFLAFVFDTDSEEALRAGLADKLAAPQVRQGGIRLAVRALEKQDSPRILLVDVGDCTEAVAQLDALAEVVAPDVKVLVVGDRTDIEFYRDITRHLGVDDYIAKPLTRDKVATLVGPHVAGIEPDAPAVRGGRVIAVCGARGGVGATTIAVNLALHLAETTHGHVALLDLHLRGGHAAMLTGGRPSAGLRHALENPMAVDSLFLDRVALRAGERLRVFAAEEAFESDPRPVPEGVGKVVDLLRQRFNTIVVDMPMPPGLPERQALAVARQALVVFGPDMASLRDAEAARKMANALTGTGRTMLVLNRANQPGALKPQIIAEALGGKPDITIPDLPKQVPQAANLGRPAIETSAALKRALAPLTQEISGNRTVQKAPLMKRLFRR